MKNNPYQIHPDAGARSRTVLEARDKRAFAMQLISKGELLRQRIFAFVGIGLAVAGIAALLGIASLFG